MKVQKSSFRTETACNTKTSENLVEGRLSLSPEKADIQRVLLLQGKVHVNSEPADGKVFMDGNVTFFVVYMDVEGNIDAFQSSSPFRHSEDVENAGAGMNVYAKGSIKEADYTIEDGRTVHVKGIVSMRIMGSTSDHYETVTGADSPDVQMKTNTQRIASTQEYKKETAVVREDIRVPQSMPVVEKILFADAYAVIKTIKTEDLKIIVEGDIKMMILYLSEDKNAPLQCFYESLPFGHILASESVTADHFVMADTDMFDTHVDIAEDENDILRLYAKINIVCAVMAYNNVEYLEDAYSLKNKLDIQSQSYTHRQAALCGTVKSIARCGIAIPETQPSISRIICMKATPVIATATPHTDRIYMDGVMLFTICYASSEGMQSFSGEIPFETEAQMEGIVNSHEVEINAEVEYCSFEGAGRDISVKFMMDVHINAYTQNDFSLVSELQETEESVSLKKGVTIYFADGGESIWDIAKRYSTTLDTVKKFNPDIG